MPAFSVVRKDCRRGAGAAWGKGSALLARPERQRAGGVHCCAEEGTGKRSQKAEKPGRQAGEAPGPRPGSPRPPAAVGGREEGSIALIRVNDN